MLGIFVLHKIRRGEGLEWGGGGELLIERALSAKEGHRTETELGLQLALWILSDKTVPLSGPQWKRLLSDRMGHTWIPCSATCVL